MWTEKQFLLFLRNFVLSTCETILNKKEATTYVLIKDPRNSLSIEKIYQLFPSAMFINIFRDGRDVVCSKIAANNEIGFGEGNVIEAAKMWRDCIVGAQKLNILPRAHFLQIRYEELLRDTPSTLKRAFDFCGLETDDDLIKKIVSENTFQKLKHERKSPDPAFKTHVNFYRKGVSGSWLQEFRTYEKILFAWIAGDILISLGYESDEEWYKKEYLKYLFNLPIAFVIMLILPFRNKIRKIRNAIVTS